MERANVAASAERLAVVGFAFRFPGPPGEGFWTALCEGRNLIGTVDAARWAPELFHHPRKTEPGTAYTRAAGSLGDIGTFDAAFFGISPREAAHLDPQQRLLLELSWEAFESAGIAPSSVRGSRSSVHIGFSGSDYGQRGLDDLAAVDAFSMTGVAGSIAANRISYFFDLRGPSMALDTACSSSLVAFHQACRSILCGDSQLALTGAVNLQLHPFPYIAFSKAAMLSKRGICSPFDADGDGYVRAEGAAIMLLKRLDQAIADGNRIYAAIAGSALNADGKTNGMTVPSCEAQTALLRDAYSQACIDPAEIDYFEAHGTGTPVGDPIEARAIGEAIGKQRSTPLPIGSVKSNLGHLETAAGMAGLVKAIYCLNHRKVPPSINFHKPNPHIAFRDWNLEVVTHTRDLDPEKRLVIGVNSFGFGGANAHVILESPPVVRKASRRASAQKLVAPLRISARSETALRETAKRYAEWLKSGTDLAPYDIAYTAAFHRDWLEHRAIACGEDRAALAGALEALANGAEAPGVVSGRALAEPRGPVFLYSGNAAQWPGMGRKLLAEDAVFRAALTAVDERFRALGGCPVLETLEREDVATLLEATEHAQPLLFAIQVGLTEMLRRWGIEPIAVAGHSVGEIAAAWASGALTLEQAVEVVHHRSRCQARTRGAGAMTAVAASEGAITPLLSDELTLAAINSGAGVTVSGPVEALAALEADLRVRSIAYRRLALDYAFHSRAMAPIEHEIREALAELKPAAARVPFYSTVDGARLEGEALDAGYWWRNIREPVQFKRAMDALLAERASVFVEVGPHAVLRSYATECLRSVSFEGRIIAVMTRTADGMAAVRGKAFQAQIAGAATQLERLFPERGRLVDLPGYPWQRERHWYTPTPEGLDLINRRALHPLLGHRIPLSDGDWESHLDTSAVPALADHCVGGEALLPASAFAEIALAAAADRGHGGPELSGLELTDLEIRAPLVLEAQRSKTLRFKLESSDSSFTLRSRDRLSSDPWRLHAVGRIWACPGGAVAPHIAQPQGAPHVDSATHYAMARAVGLDYGPAFQLVEAVWRDGQTVSARLKAPLPLGENVVPLLHPASLDGCFQLLIHALAEDVSTQQRMAFVPVKVDRLILHAPKGEARFARLALTRRSPRAVTAGAALYDASGAALATLQGVRFRAVALHKRAPALTFLGTRAIAKSGNVAPSLGSFAQRCRQRLHAAERLQARERYFADVEPLLEAMVIAFAKEALEQVREVQPASDALRTRLAEAIGDAEYPAAREIWAQLLGDYPDCAHEIIWLGRVGAHLPDLLNGAQWTPPPLAADALFAQPIADVIDEVVRAAPADRRPRILLLDAGDSSYLPRALAELDPERCDAVILCLQASLVEERKALAARYPGVVVRTGEIDEEPFDLVVAGEGLHWAAETDDAVRMLRALCADDGVLVLAEEQPSRAVALAREFLRAADPAFAGARADAPSGDALGALLEHCGFNAEIVIPEAPEVDFGSYLVLARAQRRDAPEAHLQDTARYAVFKDANGFADVLAKELEYAGAQVQLLQPQANVAGLEFDRLIYLAGMGAPLASAAERCAALGALLEACIELGNKPDIWVVTAGAHHRPEEAPLWGFARTAINEYGSLALRLADLAEPERHAEMARALAAAVRAPDAEDEMILSRAGRFAVRMQALSAPSVPAAAPRERRSIARLTLGAGTQLKQLAWTRQTLPLPGPDEVEIEVRAAGLNFRDVMFAMGQLPDEALENGFAGPSLGMEMSGIVLAVGARVQGLQSGQEVIAFAPASFATRVVTKADAVVKKPAGWSFEAAATVPATFLTAYYAMHHLGRLEHGQRILIHGAAGGVGIAAIQLAQMAGAEIFATAGSDAKRDFLRLMGVEHVLDSRSLAFADEVMRRTGGEGVDVVLNSLAGEAMSRSLSVLKPFGRFLELGKRDFYENTRLGLRPLRNNISFFAIDADQLMLERPELTRRLLQELMALFRQGRLKPLPYTLFAAADAAEAFRYMQQSKQIGKIVLGFDPAPQPPAEPAPAALHLRADATYLVTGGRRGFGLRTAQWLVTKGARNLVLVSRNAPDGEAQVAIAALEAGGVRVKLAGCDVADRAALAALFAEIRASMPPLRGVVHAAALVQDNLIRNLSRGQIEQVFAPKVRGAANLDELTRGMALDFFVLYSSATTLFGNPGQAAYVAANRYLEVLAEKRRDLGLTALCVSWGPIADAGFLARHPEIRKNLEGRMGAVSLAADDALAVLEQSLLARASGVAVVSFERHGVPRMLAAARSPKFRPLVARFDHAAGAGGDADSIQRWLAEFDDEQLAVLFTDLVRREIGAILRMAPESVDPQRPLPDLGLDSLMGVELMTAVEARFGVNLPAMAISEASTVERLAKRIVQELRRGAPEPSAEDSIPEQVRLIAAQHAPEVGQEKIDAFTADFKVTAK